MRLELFSLNEYQHAPLFQGISFPWEAFLRLKDYSNSLGGSPFDPNLFPGVFFKNSHSIFLGKGVEIEPGSFIQGPCFIGDFSQIRHGAYIRGFVITGKRCIIGHGSELKESILFNSVSVAHFNYVGNSILGNNVNLGAGVKCANFRLDGKEIRVNLDQEGKKSTGMRKLGALVGDGSQVGCNCVLSPGAILEKESLIFPLTHVQGHISRKMKG